MYSGGSGTDLDPYLISNAQDLYDIRSNNSSIFLLTNNIDLSGTAQDPWIPIPELLGELRGGGYKVSNINIVSSNQYIGFIGKLRGTSAGGIIEDLWLDKINITASGTTPDAVGGLVGYDYRTTTSQGFTVYRNIKVTGEISVDYSNENVCIGGVVGKTVGFGTSGDRTRANIKYCKTDVNIQSAAALGTGGVFGRSELSVDSGQSISFGNIEAKDYAGGVFGYMTADGFLDNYASNSVTIMSAITRYSGSATNFKKFGNHLGGVQTGGGIYVLDTMTLPSGSTPDGTPKTITELKQQSTYETIFWDFGTSEFDEWLMGSDSFPEQTVFVLTQTKGTGLFFGFNF